MRQLLLEKLSRPLILSMFGMLVAAGLSASALYAEAAHTCAQELGRACTVFEEYGYCLTVALESNADCMEDADGWLDRRVCDGVWVINYYGCAASSPFK